MQKLCTNYVQIMVHLLMDIPFKNGEGDEPLYKNGILKTIYTKKWNFHDPFRERTLVTGREGGGVFWWGAQNSDRDLGGVHQILTGV